MHVCLFDIDGTLLNTGGAGRAAMEAAVRSEFGGEIPVEGIPTVGRTDRGIMVDLLAFFDVEPDEDASNRFRDAYLRQLPEFLTDYEGQVLPGIPTLLEQLGARNDVLVGLLTGNFREGARLKLEYYELYHHFEFGSYGDAHLDRDDVARGALEEVRPHITGRLDLNRVWVIGDTLADIRCARAIGANVVAVGTGFCPMQQLQAAQPDHLLTDLADPRSLLSLLEP